MSSTSSTPAGSPPPAVAPALLERHEAALRAYLAGLPGAEPLRVDAVVRELMREAGSLQKVEDDPAVWLFTQGRRRIVTGGHRGDVLVPDGDGGQDEEAVEGEDPGIAVHRAFARLTIKQQEALRLKFQFGFNLGELAGITGVSHGGAAGLLHSGLMRLCQASGATISLGDGISPSVRLTAYALDEMEPAEKTSFAESVPDGKALLESSDSIRKTGTRLARILESGAPLPNRRRRRQGGAWWKTPWMVLVGVAVAGMAALLWYFLRDTGEKGAPRDDTPTGMNGSYAIPTRARRGESDARSQSGGSSSETLTMTHDHENFRSNAGQGKRTALGSQRRNPAGDADTPADATDDEAPTEGEPDPATSQGGERSRGASSGAAQNHAPAAGNRGDSGRADDTGRSEPEPADSGRDSSPGAETANASENPTAPAPTARNSAGAMKPSSPRAGGEPAPEPGSSEAGQAQQPTPAPAVGVAALQRDLARKRWPGPGAVRVAEMVKQGPPDADSTAGATDEPLASRVEIARSPWAPDKALVRVVLKARRAPVPSRPPANLVFSLDVSQSMAGPNRLPLVQEGVRLLAQRLRPEDRVGVVTYAATAKELLPGIALGEKALELRNCLGGLEAAGQTNGYEGLQFAYDAARRGRVEGGLNVVVLCTDGNFNLGETNEVVLAGIAAQAAAEGIKLSVFGFGRSDRNDLRLELLAAKGGGNSCYVNTREEAERLLATQIDGLLEPAAQDVVMTVSFSTERVAATARIDGGADGATTATVAELLPGRTMTALYEVSLKSKERGSVRLGEMTMTYRAPGLPVVQRRTVNLEGAEQEWAATDPSFRFAVAWAEFGRILRGDRARAPADLDRLEAWIQRTLPDDAGGYRSELLDNLAAARLAAAAGG